MKKKKSAEFRELALARNLIFPIFNERYLDWQKKVLHLPFSLKSCVKIGQE